MQVLIQFFAIAATLPLLITSAPICIQGPFPQLVLDRPLLEDNKLPENQYVICAMRNVPLVFNCSKGLQFNWETLTCDFPTRSHSQGPVWYPFPANTKPFPPPLAENENLNPLDKQEPVEVDMTPILKPAFDSDEPVPRPYPEDFPVLPLPGIQDMLPKPRPGESPILLPEREDPVIPILKPEDDEQPQFPILTPGKDFLIPRPLPVDLIPILNPDLTIPFEKPAMGKTPIVRNFI